MAVKNDLCFLRIKDLKDLGLVGGGIFFNFRHRHFFAQFIAAGGVPHLGGKIPDEKNILCPKS